jgi:hypothetical protein
MRTIRTIRTIRTVHNMGKVGGMYLERLLDTYRIASA